jgi:RNA-directed DNA polymerase
VGELKPSGKSFDISKQEVWEAYQKVRANKGAPGVDEVSLAEFEKDLKGNLYKVWNRMSSGSYFPPPVKACPAPLRVSTEMGLALLTVSSRSDSAGLRCGGWWTASPWPCR